MEWRDVEGLPGVEEKETGGEAGHMFMMLAC
jgi:hypothetical protein